MTLAELIALVESLSKAVAGVTDRLAASDKKIALLETKVATHDQQLKPFPKET